MRANVGWKQGVYRPELEFKSHLLSLCCILKKHSTLAPLGVKTNGITKATYIC